MCATSHVEGNILHEAFAVETGAFFEGNCRHADNPLAEDAGRKTSELRATPAAPAPVAPVAPAAPSNTPSAISAMVSRPMTTDASRPVAAGFAPLKS